MPDAVKYRAERETEKNRAKDLARAKERIDGLFGEGAEAFGFVSLGENTCEFLYKVAVLVYDKDLKDITIRADRITRIRVSKSTKGLVSIERAQARVVRQEV